MYNTVVNVKSLLRCFAAGLYYTLWDISRYTKGKVTILMYHRVLTDDEARGRFIQPGMYVLESTFEKHVNYLKEHYMIISFKELLEYMNTNSLDKDQAYCVITFDDGWVDNYLNAFPILREHNVSATIFLVTSFIATNRWFWPERLGYFFEKLDSLTLTGNKRDAIIKASQRVGLGADLLINALKAQSHTSRLLAYDQIIETLKGYSMETIENFLELIGDILELNPSDERLTLSWEEIKEMSDYNISFGSHGCSHSLLTLLPDDEIKAELSDSLNCIQAAGIDSIPVFCYPIGYYNKEIAKLVEVAGYRASVTTAYGYTDSSSDLYKLNRISIHDDVTKTIPLFALHVSGVLKSKFHKPQFAICNPK